MLHHVSFSVHDPEKAAANVARLTGGRSLAAPCPPFPVGTKFVVLNDGVGSMIELTPWGSVLDPEQRGVGSDPMMRPCSASHILAGTPLSVEDVRLTVAELGLRASYVDTGLFRITKIWVEASFLLELISPEDRDAYVECFGLAGELQLDGRLRAMEDRIRG